MPAARPPQRAAVAYGLAASLVVVLFMAPLALMVLGSLRLPGLPPPDGFDLSPDARAWENYQDVAQIIPLWRQLANTLLIVAVAVPVTVLVASWAGFVLAVGGTRIRRLLLTVSLVALMIPASALWVPRVVMLEFIGATDHTLVAATPALMATTPFFVLLLGFAYSRVPRSLYDAAAVEGLSTYQTWRLVAFPIARPATIAVGVLAFVFHWSNLIEPLLLLSRESTWPVSLGLRTLASYEPTFYPLLLAASVLVTLPAVLAFVLVQRAFFSRTLGV